MLDFYDNFLTTLTISHILVTKITHLHKLTINIMLQNIPNAMYSL